MSVKENHIGEREEEGGKEGREEERKGGRKLKINWVCEKILN